jgi:hypothetical protein
MRVHDSAEYESRGPWMAGRITPLWLALQCLAALSCHESTNPDHSPDNLRVSSDQELFELVAREMSTYSLFPNTDSVVAGTLNGSSAHRPEVRVSLNSAAGSALSDGRLNPGSSFPDGSVILKEIREEERTTLFAVLYKDRENAHSAGGWLWAELTPDGTVQYSLKRMGEACIGCHALESGARNDHIRTFERQRE